tara:strand:- start:346 stop:948 length:603 start_codon:yes stop_codon:yes gene_type:complete
MAIELKNSMFIHVPKCGGRTAKMMLKRYVNECKVLGDDIYESHATPDTTKQVFGFIRHPATFVHSLWTHRSKKKNHGSEWNWHPDIKLEQECKSKDYNTFIENVINGNNLVWDYYMHYLGKYKDPMIGKMEELPNSLISILKSNNEEFKEEDIKNNIYVHGANDRQKNKPVELEQSMTSDQCRRLMESETKLKEFGYHAF